MHKVNGSMKFRNFAAVFLICILSISTSVSAEEPANLYKVLIHSQNDADNLAHTGAQPLLRINGGYLVFLKEGMEKNLDNHGLEFEKIAADIDRSRLALDIRMDNENVKKYPVIYEENGVRLLMVDPSDFSKAGETPGLAPILTEDIQFKYISPAQPIRINPEDVIGLDSLISLVIQDSCQSYVEALQAFPPRVTGSQADYDSRDWIYDKFVEFGYDSVVFDSFNYSGYDVQNIVAYKIGSDYPDHHIVVGGHKDAVSGSPGADDNGSGTAGVLEIARVLKDIDTKMTFVFICFTGEEQGLHGAWHYANEAAANGDSIVVMLNMDMIGNYENTNHVTLYYGDDMTYAYMFQDLADSLTGVGLISHLSGSIPYSDHYAFQQNGYPVCFTIEYEFSDYYHTYQDSTTYMDFSYMARIVKGQLATGYHANNTYVPAPGLVFSYPDGIPSVLTPGVPETFQVLIEGSCGGIPQPGTGIIHVDVEGSMPQSIPMTDLGGGLYEAFIPPQSCGRPIVDFWFSAVERNTAVEIFDPEPDNPYTAVVATSVITAFDDDFETDQGWNVSGGLWARGTPTGGGGQYGNPDPSAAYSGTNIFGYNLNGDYESSLPERHLTSPPIDCSGLFNVRLKFWRWLGVEQPIYDHAYIRISNDGDFWTTIWENEEEITDDEWIELTYDISNYADDQSVVYVRFTMGTTDGAWQYCGWNIDDLEVTGYQCESGAMIITTESLPDWTALHPYTQQLEVSGGVGNITWSDKYGELIGTGLTLSGEGLISGTVMTSQAISFTATASDETKTTTEKGFSFFINESLEITTSSIPDGVEGEPFSEQLNSSGGTGSTAWSDKNSDLSGTGLTLSSSGLLSGTPTDAISISFIALATDDIGATDEQLFSFDIAATFICGNANGDTLVNILDITYIISYLYMSGPPPEPVESADVNNSGDVNILDITALIGFLYKEGPPLECP